MQYISVVRSRRDGRAVCGMSVEKFLGKVPGDLPKAMMSPFHYNQIGSNISQVIGNQGSKAGLETESLSQKSCERNKDRQSRRPLALRIMTPDSSYSGLTLQKTCEILDIVFEIGGFVTEMLGNLGLSARGCSFICT